MKLYLLSWVFFYISIHAVSAQFFKLVPDDSDRLYFQTNQYLFAAEVKSIEDSVSREIIQWEGLTEVEFSTNCYRNSSPDLLGKRIWIEDSGDHLIQMDSTGELIATIKTHAQVDESWICFEYNGETVTATCVSNVTGSVNGIPELIKTIRFSNGFCDMRISQTQGIVSTPSWNQLYVKTSLLYSYPVKCVDRIWDQVLIEKLIIPFGEMASDLHEGDVLHIEETYSEPIFSFGRKLIKAQFLNKTFDTLTNNYHLNFRREVDEWKNTNGQITQTIYIDTAITYIQKDLWLDTSKFEYPVPINRIFGTGEIIKYSLFNDRLSSHVSYLSFEGSYPYTCFPFVFDYGSTTTFIDGLGGPYYSQATGFSNERTLKYYKKGTEEWGEPFTFIVSASEKIISESISIYPNPVAAGSQIFLQDLGGNEFLNISLVDLHGKQVQSWELKNTTNQESLNLQKNIPAGMYVLWITNDELKQFYSKVLVK